MTTTQGRWKRRLLLAALVLLGLLLAGLLTLWLLARQAAAVWPREVTALALPGPPWPVEDGAWDDFVAMSGKMEKRQMGWLSQAITDEGQPADADLGRWREHEDALQAMDALVARSGLRGPTLELDDSMPPVIPALNVARLRLLRAWWHAAAGDPLRASQDLIAAQRLGMLLEQAGSSLLLAMVGLGIQDGVTDETGEMLQAYPGWPAEALIPLARSLVTASMAPNGMLAGLAAECLAQERLLRRMAGQSTIELLRQTSGTTARGDTSSPPAAGSGSWFFDVDATAAMGRQRCQRRIREYGKPAPQRQPLDEPRLWPGGARKLTVLLDNPIGRIVMDLAQPNVNHFMEHSDRVRARRALLGLRLAVLAFAQEHQGSRPGALADLAPDILPEVPLDPYTGQGFVYDPGAATLASAGASQDDERLRVSLESARPASAPAP
ncbi:MAG: hypothetical protein JXR83_11995 [Deltaproteobacteria bacterium]|nr:hypothetical protein [Deltaproteobacteria bacterium]